MPMNLNKVLVLVNPISGRGLGPDRARELQDTLRARGIEARVEVLLGPGAADGLVRSLGPKADALVAVGGDGTINEVVEALFRNRLPMPLAILPLGLSNCLARHLNLPLASEALARVLTSGRTRKLDLLEFPGGVVHSFLGAGFDASVVARVAEARTGPVNDRLYVNAAFKALAPKSWPRLRLWVDGIRVPGEFFQILAISTTNYAHYFNLPSGAGFSILAFSGRGPWSLFRSLIKAGLERRLDRSADVIRPVSGDFRIEGGRARAFFQFDGEKGGRLPVACRVAAEALEIFW